MSEFLDSYNVVWDTPSIHSGESMPCGGHDIGLNVWVERSATCNGDLLFYIDRSGSFDENNQMLKLGRVRLQLDPNPFADGLPFRQTLKLRQGHVEIIAGNPGQEVRVDVWVEVARPIIHVEVQSQQPLTITASYENWRLSEREIPYERRHPCASWVAYPDSVTTEPDHVLFTQESPDTTGVLFYHRNRNDRLVIDRLIEQQGLTSVKGEIPNTQRNRTFGGMLFGPNMREVGTREGQYGQIPYRAWMLRSQSPSMTQRIDVALHTAQSETLADWQAALNQLASSIGDLALARTKTQAWWGQFWDRSHLCLQPTRPDPTDKAWQVGRNYWVI